MRIRELLSKKASDGREKADRVRLLLALIFAALTGLLMFLFGRLSDLLFPGYRRFSRFVMRILSSITGLVPFAVWDIVIALIAVSSLAGLVLMLVKHRRFLSWFSRLALAVSCLFFIETAVWNLNHYGPRLKDEMGLTVEQYGSGELLEAFTYYFDRAAEAASLAEREADGTLTERDLGELCREAGMCYTPLESEFEVFRGGSKARAKYVTVGSLVLPYLGISGEFVGFTGEATVLLGPDTVNHPFSLCHEVGHRLGIASEEDANFAAFLACTASDDPLFCYSGYYSAFIYCYNALADSDINALSELIESRSGSGYSLLIADCDRAAEYYAQFDSPVEEVADAVTDAALKAFSETDGIRSYSLVVNELIAWYYLRKEG